MLYFCKDSGVQFVVYRTRQKNVGKGAYLEVMAKVPAETADGSKGYTFQWLMLQEFASLGEAEAELRLMKQSFEATVH